MTVGNISNVVDNLETSAKDNVYAILLKKNARVLIVDDVAADREIFSDILRDTLNYSNIQVSKDGDCALKLSESYRPHLVLMDSNMPRRHGYEVCEQLRQRDYGRNIAIIGMSDSNHPSVEKLWKEAGSDGFIGKKDIFENPLALDKMIQISCREYPHLINNLLCQQLGSHSQTVYLLLYSS